MENLTATYAVHTIGLADEIEAVSFQDAAQKMLEKHKLTSVQSIAKVLQLNIRTWAPSTF